MKIFKEFTNFAKGVFNKVTNRNEEVMNLNNDMPVGTGFQIPPKDNHKRIAKRRKLERQRKTYNRRKANHR